MIVQAWRIPAVKGLWLVEDSDGKYWKVPAVPGGWSLRGDFPYYPSWEPESPSTTIVLAWVLRAPGAEPPGVYIAMEVAQEVLDCRRQADAIPTLRVERPMGWSIPDGKDDQDGNW